MNNRVDNTINGKCSRCGNCCDAILLLSEKEIQKIKSYVGQKKIHPINHNNITDQFFSNICPFYDNTIGCMIYPVRPEICKRFLCSNYLNKNSPYFNHSDKKIVNMYEIFMPEVKNYKKVDFSQLQEYYEEEKKKVRI